MLIDFKDCRAKRKKFAMDSFTGAFVVIGENTFAFMLAHGNAYNSR
jgi:hypothetical protein